MQLQAVKGYRAATVNTVDRLHLVVLCYEGCIAHVTRAREELLKGNLAAKGVHLGKATSIVSELLNVLDMEKGGEIAERLATLYQYVLDAFLKANLRNEAAHLDGALKVLQELKQGWVELSKRGTAAELAANG